MKEEQFAQCMKRIAGGDKDALREIYEEYLGYLYSVVYGVLGHKETAEDVTSDVFLRIWNTADKFSCKVNTHWHTNTDITDEYT